MRPAGPAVGGGAHRASAHRRCRRSRPRAPRGSGGRRPAGQLGLPGWRVWSPRPRGCGPRPRRCRPPRPAPTRTARRPTPGPRSPAPRSSAGGAGRRRPSAMLTPVVSRAHPWAGTNGTRRGRPAPAGGRLEPVVVLVGEQLDQAGPEVDAFQIELGLGGPAGQVVDSQHHRVAPVAAHRQHGLIAGRDHLERSWPAPGSPCGSGYPLHPVERRPPVATLGGLVVPCHGHPDAAASLDGQVVAGRSPRRRAGPGCRAGRTAGCRRAPAGERSPSSMGRTRRQMPRS